MQVKEALVAIVAGQHLSRTESSALFARMMAGELTPGQIGGVLTALATKGETAAEIAGAADAMRAVSTKVQTSATPLVDTCGTGGSGAKLFNISTAAAFVVAAAGAKVAKHGNRKMTSNSGSADVLEAAGANVSLRPEQIAHCVEEVGIGFMFAQAHHSAMRHAGPVRQELGVRTLMNILGPMTNPAGARSQVMGVFAADKLELVCEVLQLLGSEHVLVVHSQGLDEVRLDAPSEVVELKDGAIRRYQVQPEDLGIATRSVDGIIADSTESSLKLIRQSLTDPDSAAADIVALNAGAAIYAAGVARSWKMGVDMAQDAIAAGLANERLQEFVRITKLMGESNND
ncbi:MAG: anthranilate phosphoribosyltransferase [Pseudomonadales bacterium]